MHLVVITKSVVCKDRLVLLSCYSDLILKPVSYLCGRNGRLEGVTSQCNQSPLPTIIPGTSTVCQGHEYSETKSDSRLECFFRALLLVFPPI